MSTVGERIATGVYGTAKDRAANAIVHARSGEQLRDKANHHFERCEEILNSLPEGHALRDNDGNTWTRDQLGHWSCGVISQGSLKGIRRATATAGLMAAACWWTT